MAETLGKLNQYFSDTSRCYLPFFEAQSMFRDEGWGDHRQSLDEYFKFINDHNLIHILSLATVSATDELGGESLVITADFDNKDLIVFVRLIRQVETGTTFIVLNLADFRHSPKIPFVKEEEWVVSDMDHVPQDAVEELKRANRQISYGLWVTTQ